MGMHIDWILVSELGGLFVSAFLGATLLPFSSEAALTAALVAGAPVLPALVSASLGNCLAVLFNYWMGRRWGLPFVARVAETKGGRAAVRAYEKYGTFSLFFTWLPIIGDPLTVIAGVFRLDLLLFMGIVFSTRILRYVVIAGVLQLPW